MKTDNKDIRVIKEDDTYIGTLDLFEYNDKDEYIYFSDVPYKLTSIVYAANDLDNKIDITWTVREVKER